MTSSTKCPVVLQDRFAYSSHWPLTVCLKVLCPRSVVDFTTVMILAGETGQPPPHLKNPSGSLDYTYAPFTFPDFNVHPFTVINCNPQCSNSFSKFSESSSESLNSRGSWDTHLQSEPAAPKAIPNLLPMLVGVGFSDHLLTGRIPRNKSWADWSHFTSTQKTGGPNQGSHLPKADGPKDPSPCHWGHPSRCPHLDEEHTTGVSQLEVSHAVPLHHPQGRSAAAALLEGPGWETGRWEETTAPPGPISRSSCC